MDAEAFVLTFARFDLTGERCATVTHHLREKRSDLMRFYTEGGVAWLMNNVAFSGKVLWQRADGPRITLVNTPRRMGYDVAVDMCRHLGFLVHPLYSKGSLQALLETDPRRAHEVLGEALGRTKYFIRLIDAYQIGHESGNSRYNRRLARRPKDAKGFDLSYYYQIYRDAKAKVAAERAGGPKSIFTEGGRKPISRSCGGWRRSSSRVSTTLPGRCLLKAA